MNAFVAIAAAWIFGASPGTAGTDSAHERVEFDDVLGGDHWRLITSEGPVHVWAPRLYDRDTAGTLIYVHGYYSSVDQAWTEHRLPQQFRDSKQNALFIVPESPQGDDEAVRVKDLDRLLDEIGNMTRRRLPKGPITVLAHSGGFRSVVEWLKSGKLDQVMLLDGLYENEQSFDAWLKEQRKLRRRGNKLIVVASETVARSDAFVKRFRNAVTHGRIPDNAFELSKQERKAEVLYMRTTAEHMQLVTEGKVIPFLIKLAPFPKL
jgi:hypothetical protein